MTGLISIGIYFYSLRYPINGFEIVYLMMPNKPYENFQT
ncbi:MAG: hypothetical protein BWX51_00835 [Bacteroidetes bacterium ADurb.Bin012]|jgi:hypothetical protein|nr:MAG: hypothetical protein BWX51_00835 [Bacteroidetes bacterium ADurb.Bin012]